MGSVSVDIHGCQTVGHEELTVGGATYRQIDYWTRKRYLRAEGVGGQGHVRRWPASEVAVAAMMARLVAANIPPELAAAVARAGGDMQVAPGIRIVVSPDQ